MGFITGLYKTSTPLIQSSIFFRSFDPAGTVNNGKTSRYRIILEDGVKTAQPQVNRLDIHASPRQNVAALSHSR